MIEKYFKDIKKSIDLINYQKIEEMINLLSNIKGRLFIIGIGGSAANASHAVNDFRKIANIESYCPTDNVSELTARINDNGWDTSLSDWLKVSRLNNNDIVMILSVGGGDRLRGISINIINAIEYSKMIGCKVIGLVGLNQGYTPEVADICIRIPSYDTFQVESIQSILLHLLVSHPKLKKSKTKWEEYDDESDIFR